VVRHLTLVSPLRTGGARVGALRAALLSGGGRGDGGEVLARSVGLRRPAVLESIELRTGGVRVGALRAALLSGGGRGDGGEVLARPGDLRPSVGSGLDSGRLGKRPDSADRAHPRPNLLMVADRHGRRH
jgi:hypothetical protein